MARNNHGSNNPFYGKHHTEETRRKISAAGKGRIAWNKGLKGYGAGHPVSEETRKKISLKVTGKPGSMLGKHHSEETKEKIRLGNLGKKISEETIQRLSESHKGLKQSEETKRWRSEHWMGSKNPRWKGGIPIDQDYMRARWHKRRAREVQNGGFFSGQEWLEMKEKCDFCCPLCMKKEPEIKLSIDHVIPISKGGANKASNIQPLCTVCNAKKGTKILQSVS